MKLEFIPDSELEKLPKITSELIVRRNKFHPEGLFSEQIFGPVNSYRCWCKNTSEFTGQRCKKCGIELISSSTRRTRYAVIEVERIINPLAMELLMYNKKLSQIINKILNMKLCLYMHEIDKIIYVPIKQNSFDPNKDFLTEELKIPLEEINMDKFKFGLDAIFEIACLMCDQNKNSMLLDKLKDLIVNNNFFSKYILVIPPDLRPVKIQKKINLDSLNKHYLTILLMLNKDIMLTGTARHVFECKIQQISNQITKHIFDVTGKKEGLLRNKMAGKRIDFSARSVAAVDPEIPITHVKVPRLILLQLWKLEIAKELIKRGDFVTFKMAFDYLQRIYDEYNIPQELVEIIDRVASEQFVIANRQPTLHRGGMYGFKVIPHNSNVIGFNPLICDSLNLDFDGDSICGKLDIDVIVNNRTITKTLNIMDLKDLEIEINPTH